MTEERQRHPLLRDMHFLNGPFFWALCVAWTALILASLWWNLHQKHNALLAVAHIQAETAVEKDVLYRRWNASHGGVYARVDASTPPNPYLSPIDREALTPNGVLLTRINPAYMTRQVYDLGTLTSGVMGHITSLKPIHPRNAPDAWERRALELLAQGQPEFSQVQVIGSYDYLRLMKPLATEQSCLKCHAEQGYQLGDIRGGIGVAVPLDPLRQSAARERHALILGHVLLWLVGMSLLPLGFYMHQLRTSARRQQERNRVEKERLLAAVQTAGAACHQINQPLQSVLSNIELLLMEMPDDDAKGQRIRLVQEQLEGLAKIMHRLNRITDFQTTEYLRKDRILDLEQSSKSTD